MTIGEIFKKLFNQRKEVEVYNPQREHIDRVYDNKLRQLDFYRKKAAIPRIEKQIQRYEKQHYGNTMHTKDENNILKVPNMITQKNNFKWKKGGMI